VLAASKRFGWILVQFGVDIYTYLSTTTKRQLCKSRKILVQFCYRRRH